MYLIGGFEEFDLCAPRACIGAVQAYNPVTDTWRVGTQLPFSTSGSVNVAVVEGKIHACGGLYTVDDTTGSPWNPRDCAVYQPGTDTWHAMAPMLRGVDHAATGTDGMHVYVFGGRDSGENINDVGIDTMQIYDVAADTWRYVHLFHRLLPYYTIPRYVEL